MAQFAKPVIPDEIRNLVKVQLRHSVPGSPPSLGHCLDSGSPCIIGFPQENSTGLASSIAGLGRDDGLRPGILKEKGT
jgi:hypothetical protein